MSVAGYAVCRRERNDAYRNPVKYYIKAMSSYNCMYIIPANCKELSPNSEC